MLTNSSVVPQKPPVGFYHIITTVQNAGAYMIEIPLKSNQERWYSVNPMEDGGETQHTIHVAPAMPGAC